ncbi:hypothetical protein LTR36_003203 [Oleoguttula mirabilis]|uniref:Uncharacterized protein n=1 Tax=Oleoguttula mirabilis TaxID=1507867 RepID=A0AAV9JYL9_9PEZI|nr:hypothetical protein LTR36_003203 [Oleoguttula mirabilis]
MEDTKDAVREEAYDLGPSIRTETDGSTTAVDDFGSNGLDVRNMQRMGKDQEMTRVFRQASLLCFTCVLMGTWEWILLATTQVLVAGGRAGLFWTFLWSYAGYGFLIASLAEMAAMAPTAGGQYHWVSEFAPRSCQRLLSYVSGWLSILCWQAGNASGMFLAGYMVQSLAVLRNPSYAAPVWQGFLLVIAVVLISTVFNIWAERLLPALQNLTMCLHVAAFIATVSVFWALGPRIDARTALLDFTDDGGWTSMGLALMVGQISAVVALSGCDAAAHMSEEVRDAGLSVPRAMFWTFWINGLMAFLVMISYVFAIADIEDAINDPSGFPVIYALRYAAGPTGAMVLVSIQLVLLMVGNTCYQASTARQTFAFARDGGLPFSK